MRRRVHEVIYNGLDKKERIDCLAQIRKIQNPSGSTCLDIEGLCKGRRSTKDDVAAVKEKRVPGKFVRIGKIDF